MTTQKITSCLWFDGQAEEAMNFYVSVFNGSPAQSRAGSKALGVSRYTKGGMGTEGSVMTTRFELNGQEFLALNGGPLFKFTEAVSMIVNCESQEEVDYFWEKLSAGGKEVQCGWLKDKFGLSWQVVPTIIRELMEKGSPEQSARVMQAVMKMVKLDIATIEKAYESGSN